MHLRRSKKGMITRFGIPCRNHRRPRWFLLSYFGNFPTAIDTREPEAGKEPFESACPLARRLVAAIHFGISTIP
jgi:hypothetical protein